MSALFWQSMSGVEGKVVVPAVGAVVGTINRWTLSRPEESSPGNPGLLTLKAFFSYVNPLLMNDDGITKDVLINIRKDKRYRVCGGRTAFDGTVLTIEGASLCQPEE